MFFKVISVSVKPLWQEFTSDYSNFDYKCCTLPIVPEVRTCVKKPGAELSLQDNKYNCSWAISLSFVNFVKSSSNYNPNIKPNNFTGCRIVTCHLNPSAFSIISIVISQIHFQEENFPLKIFIPLLKTCEILCTNAIVKCCKAMNLPETFFPQHFPGCVVNFL